MTRARSYNNLVISLQTSPILTISPFHTVSKLLDQVTQSPIFHPGTLSAQISRASARFILTDTDIAASLVTSSILLYRLRNNRSILRTCLHGSASVQIKHHRRRNRHLILLENHLRNVRAHLQHTFTSVQLPSRRRRTPLPPVNPLPLTLPTIPRIQRLLPKEDNKEDYLASGWDMG